jgi:hypothetical protein
VYDAAFAPLESVQEAVTEEFDDLSYYLRAKLGLLKKDIEVALAQYKRATDKGVSLSDAERKALEEKLKDLHRQQGEMEDMLEQPPAVWTSDFTSEALGARLHNNNEVIAVLSDEGGIALYDLIGRYSDGDFSDDMLLCKCFSVNSHAVDRITRGRIVLRRPCVALLLLVQPDILRRAFENTRLLIGGFLARCFAADTRLKMQEETDESAVHFDEEIALKWAGLLMALYKKFHDADKPYRIEVEPAVRAASRMMYNEIVQKVRYQLSDVSSFACRWVEQTWKVAIILHMVKHGIEGIQKALAVDSFNQAKDIVRYFVTKQLEVLAVMRREEIKKTHHRLQEIFIENNFVPITLRNLDKTHNLTRESVQLCVKAYPAVYGILERKNSQGGGYSTLLFLKENPPCFT